jgi:hypothetical protein
MQFFFYGSLMDRELLALVIGRTGDELRMEAATIHDSSGDGLSMSPFRSSCRTPADGSGAHLSGI